MLFPSSQVRFLNKILKRQLRLEEALQRARANRLPAAIVALYEATLAAHTAVQDEYKKLADVADQVFDEASSYSQNAALAGHAGRIAAFERDVDAFTEAKSRSSDPQADLALRSREAELIERFAALELERVALLKASAARGGIANTFDQLQKQLERNVLNFDRADALKQLGSTAGTTAIKTGAGIALPGSGVILAASDAADRYFEGQMIEDDKAQTHYLWLDSYRQTAEDWATRVRGFLRLLQPSP